MSKKINRLVSVCKVFSAFFIIMAMMFLSASPAAALNLSGVGQINIGAIQDSINATTSQLNETVTNVTSSIAEVTQNITTAVTPQIIQNPVAQTAQTSDAADLSSTIPTASAASQSAEQAISTAAQAVENLQTTAQNAEASVQTSTTNIQTIIQQTADTSTQAVGGGSAVTTNTSTVNVTVSAADGNLVPNPTLAVAGTDGLPQNWFRGNWGTNTTQFSYPATGYDDAFAAKLEITSYSSGDSKWYFSPVAITPGNYQFSDYYQSNATSVIVAQYANASGQLSYVDLATLPASATWKNASTTFTVPAGTASMTIFHLINSVGWLTIDKYSLTPYTAPVIPQPPPPTSSNLILNPSAEYLDATGLPIGWSKGNWGANTAVLSVINPAQNGKNALKTAITGYTDGDAKWFFAPVAAKPNYVYTFTDYYQSNIPSYVTVEFKLSDNTLQYADIGMPASASAWTKFSANFSTPPNVQSLTVYHLIKGIGWLNTDNYKLAEVKSSQLSQGIVSLNFDDGWLSAYQNAWPILKTAGLKSTFYLFTDSFTDPEDYMTLAQAKSLYSAGNEIGSHSKTHVDLTTVSSTKLTDEVKGSKTWFSSNGITTRTFAYPYGSFNQVVENAAKSAGYSAARSSNTGYNDRAANKYEIKVQSVENTTTFDQIKSWIDYAKQNKVWLTLLFHEVLANTSAAQYSTTPAIIQQTANYLKSQSVTVQTNYQAIQTIGL